MFLMVTVKNSIYWTTSLVIFPHFLFFFAPEFFLTCIWRKMETGHWTRSSSEDMLSLHFYYTLPTGYLKPTLISYHLFFTVKSALVKKSLCGMLGSVPLTTFCLLHESPGWSCWKTIRVFLKERNEESVQSMIYFGRQMVCYLVNILIGIV